VRWLITTDGPHAHHYHRLGVGNALRHCGHEVLLMDIRHQSPYDVFERFDPEVVWTQSYNLNDPMIDCIKNSNCKVFMRAFDFGPMGKTVEKLNESGHNIMIEQASTKEIANVVSIADRISFVCNHYVPSMLMDAMEDWKEFVKVKPNMLGFCPFIYGGGEERPEFRSDVSFIGSYHHRKPALNDYIVGLNQVKKGKENLNVKIFSSWNWPSEYYCGVIPPELNKHVYFNATVCPNVSEDHSRLIGHDVIERIFAILGSGNFCLSDYVKGAAELFPDEMVFADSVDEFHRLVVHYAENPHETQIFADKGKEVVWKNHTYFHRAADLFDNLELPVEAEHIRRQIPAARLQLA
jgi:hypothetical protein